MSNISLSRGIDKKTISLTKKKDEGLQLPISELIKLTGLFVKQKDSEGNVIVDYTNDLVYLLDDGKVSDTFNFGSGTTEVKIAMPWKDKYTSIGLSVFVEVEDEEEDVLVFEDDSEKSEKEDNDTPPLFQDEPVNQPDIQIDPEVQVVEQEKPVVEQEVVTPEVKKEEEHTEVYTGTTAPATTDNVPVLKKGTVLDGVYTFYDDVLIGARGPIMHKIPELNVNVSELFSKEEQANLDGFDKMILSVHPINVQGITRVDQNIAANDFDYDANTSDLHWETNFPNPLPFTNLDHSKSPNDVVGLHYELQFVPVFKPTPVMEEVPVVGDWSSLLVSHPAEENTPEVPVTSGWDSLTSDIKDQSKENVVKEHSFDDVFSDNFSEVKPVPQTSAPQENNNSFAEQPVNSGFNSGHQQSGFDTGKVQPLTENSNPSGYEEHFGQTLSYPGAILSNTGVYPTVPPVTPNNNFGYETGFDTFGTSNEPQANQFPQQTQVPQNHNEVGGVENFTQPQVGSRVESNRDSHSVQSDEIDKELADIKVKAPEKKGFLDKVFGSFKKKQKKGGSKKGIILGTLAIVLVIGSGTTAGVMYRNAGIKDISSVKETVEANLVQVNKYLEDGEITSEESVQIQKLLNENTKAIEDNNSGNYFAGLEKNRLIKENNKATTTATNLINKQSGVSSNTTETKTETKAPEQTVQPTNQ